MKCSKTHDKIITVYTAFNLQFPHLGWYCFVVLWENTTAIFAWPSSEVSVISNKKD